MADDASNQAPATSPKPDEPSTRPNEGDNAATADTAAETAAADTTAAAVDADDKADATKTTIEDTAGTAPKTAAAEKENAEADTSMEQDTAAGEGATTGVGSGTPGTAKKDKRRKSSAAVPEHKKKLNKKKSMPDLHLNVRPGEFWWARMKGHPPWPAIICDEEMLPESLLSKRPVSAMRTDGTYREDFLEGGKNARDRRYPVMFLGTNEFAWQINTDLDPMDMDELKALVEKGDQGKRSKLLWEAYQIAAEGHGLAHFKEILLHHEQALQEDREEQAEQEAKKQAKKDKRKSKDAAADDEDVSMEDADGDADAPKAKLSKKRKKAADSDAEDEKPAKTPKTKLKVNGPKTPREESAAKPKKASKSKKAAKAKDESEDDADRVEEPPMTEEEKRQKREKTVLYLRHKLQKGFLTRDQAPKEEEMKAMAEYFAQLEQFVDLEVAIIRTTKINKVLKGIMKLENIPKEEEYKFKQRSNDLLTAWNKVLAKDSETPGDAPATAPGAETANGVANEEKGDESKSPAPAASTDPVETTGVGNAAVDEADVTMEDAKPDQPAESAANDAKEPEAATETSADVAATKETTATA